MTHIYDIAIIGGGVTGAATAYELSKRQLSVLWLEKENDLAMGATRANTAIIHGGYDPAPDTLMGKLNVAGAELCMELCETLNVEYRETGSYVIAFTPEDEAHLTMLYERGLKNGVRDMRIVDGDTVRADQPHLSEKVTKALRIPRSGVMNPWEFALAMGEVAVRNGVELKLGQEVTAIAAAEDGYTIRTQTDTFRSAYVINAAGVHSDEIHNLVAEPTFTIVPTRGEYYLLDRTVGPLVTSVIFQCPTEQSKGVLVSPTIHDNILVGPNSEVIDDKENTAVTRAALDLVARDAAKSVPDIDFSYSIRNYAGVRANSDRNDFVIEFAAPRFLDLAAIKSPGLTCAPAIARLAVEMLAADGLAMTEKSDWRGGRDIVRFKSIPEAERAAFIRNNPLYGRVICRCETITEGEIVAAMRREIPPVSLDGMKRRAGTGMGRCQGGFCGPRVLEIIAREAGIAPDDVLNDADGSYILTERTKGGRHA